MKAKIIKDGYITAVGEEVGGIEISECEYEEIISIIRNAPAAPDGYHPALKADLTWDLLPNDDDPLPDEISAEEFLAELEAIL